MRLSVLSISQAIQLTAQIILQLSLNTGIGRHRSALSYHEATEALKWAAVFQILAVASSVTGKLAIMGFLVQIRGLRERRPWFFWTLGILLIAINVVDFGTMLGQCRPMRKIWDSEIQGTCEPGRKVNEIYSFFQAGFNAFSDALLAAYPIHLFWKLQMELRVKIGLWFLMGLGWIAAVCAAIKTYQIRYLMDPSDLTYKISLLLIWGSTESWIILIVSCIPPIKPVVKRILEILHIISTASSSSKNRYYNHNYASRSGIARSFHPQSLSRPGAAYQTFNGGTIDANYSNDGIDHAYFGNSSMYGSRGLARARAYRGADGSLSWVLDGIGLDGEGLEMVDHAGKKSQGKKEDGADGVVITTDFEMFEDHDRDRE